MKTVFKSTRYLLLIIILTCASNVVAQVAKIEPAEPRWGTTLTVTYNPKAEGAKLTGADDIYMSFGLSYYDHTERMTVKMNQVGNVFKYDLAVRPNVASIFCQFITVSEWDKNARASTIVYRPDGVAAKGAYQSKVGGTQYREMAEKELALYSDNYLVYRDKWYAARAYDKTNYRTLVKADMDRLTIEVKEKPADLLYSLSYGYLLLQQEEKSREMLKVLVRQYPTSQLITAAFSNYEYEVFSQEMKGDGPKEIAKIKRELSQQYPDSELARANVMSLAYDKEVPLAQIEAICEKWTAQVAEHPMPYLSLARAYSLRRQKMDQAATLVEKAINLLLEGKLRLNGDILGFVTGQMLPMAYLISADIALYEGDYAKALSAAKAAEALGKETESKSFMVEGEVWQKLGQSGRAEGAYLEAWQRGGKQAEAELKILYQKRKGSLDGFDEYMNSKRLDMANASARGKPTPQFSATSLDGEKFDLTALRGKVVVLNFWFIGCAPCRVEMPGLNQLVSEFKGKDVVFLAFANDSADDLRAFLKQKTFDYRITPEGSKIAESYEVTIYPTHIVIGKDGRIVSRLFGGSDKRHDELRPVIERALSGQ